MGEKGVWPEPALLSDPCVAEHMFAATIAFGAIATCGMPRSDHLSRWGAKNKNTEGGIDVVDAPGFAKGRAGAITGIRDTENTMEKFCGGPHVSGDLVLKACMAPEGT